MDLKTVKLGTPVLYSINGHEYTGVALGSVSVGYNQARVAAGHHVNLIYLNEQGTPIKVWGAPLLSEVTTDDHLDEQLELEEKVLGDRDKAVAAIEARDVRIGWKPYIDICATASASDEAMNMLNEHAEMQAKLIEQLQGEVKDLTQQLNDEKAAHERAVQAAANAAGRGNNEQENQS